MCSKWQIDQNRNKSKPMIQGWADLPPPCYTTRIQKGQFKYSGCLILLKKVSLEVSIVFRNAGSQISGHLWWTLNFTISSAEHGIVSDSTDGNII